MESGGAAEDGALQEDPETILAEDRMRSGSWCKHGQGLHASLKSFPPLLKMNIICGARNARND